MARKLAVVEVPRVNYPCAFDGCHLYAMCRIQTPTGWANLCHDHYNLHARNEAREYCISRGLDTRERQVAYIKKVLRESRLFKGVRV